MAPVLEGILSDSTERSAQIQSFSNLGSIMQIGEESTQPTRVVHLVLDKVT